ncbi:hypothetical protein A6X21_23310 [Planctopirus hydrillae]|uniref:Uncharacterized protein n=1 Tax=Planctopirus hydrillae TaxID=1841610 RepID=A0A1C3ECL9_9PLAN|nr:hypothetical protein A6X21_23310 [Planctopirus hydrillae]
MATGAAFAAAVLVEPAGPVVPAGTAPVLSKLFRLRTVPVFGPAADDGRAVDAEFKGCVATGAFVTPVTELPIPAAAATGCRVAGVSLSPQARQRSIPG